MSTANPIQWLSINLDEHEQLGASTWELPPWGHVLGCGVYPLLIYLDGRFRPIGTAFSISRVGIVATATHNIFDALKSDPRGQALLQKEILPRTIRFADFGTAGLSVLHNHSIDPETIQITLWPLERGSSLLIETSGRMVPADLAFSSAASLPNIPLISLPISPSVPRVGSKVKCVGYVPAGSFSADDVSSGQLAICYSHRLKLIEATVRAVFTEKFAAGYLESPCFAVDAEADHGMSGGPVFNDKGYVCGVISAGASNLFDYPSTLVSPFYPAMLSEIGAMGSLCALIANGTIRTDGSESLVAFTPDGEMTRVGAMVHREDMASVFDNFVGYQEGTPATKEPINPGTYRMKTANN
jgi:Trypsin-like peptidase domain